MAYKARSKRGKNSASPRSWKLFSNTIRKLYIDGASAKDIGEMVAKYSEFSEHLVKIAGCKDTCYTDNDELVIRALVQLGLRRVCELAASQELWSQLID